MKIKMMAVFPAVFALAALGFVALGAHRGNIPVVGPDKPITSTDIQSTKLPEPNPVATANGTGEQRASERPACTYELLYIPRSDGSLIAAYKCASVTATEHPYNNYSNETLMELAYSDAKASEVLGLRLRETDFEVALSLTVRAAALAGGDAEPIQYFSDAYPYSTYTNDEPNLETIRVRYVLSAVSNLLGAEDSNVGYWENKVRQEFDHPMEAIGDLNTEARRIVAEMRDIENEVKGEVTIQIKEVPTDA